VLINDVGYGSLNNPYFGRVDQNGTIIAGRDLTPAVESLLEEFAANPVEVAQRYGALTGNCMFCDKKLDDATSVAVGYGPVCAKKWNLPHSAAKQSRKSRKEGIPTLIDGTPCPTDAEYAAQSSEAAKEMLEAALEDAGVSR
jgi:hypothetical protein